MTRLRDKIFFSIILCIFIIITLRLWHLQIIKGEKYSKLSEQNRIRIIKIPAPRGIIYDRNGIPLVENIPSFSLSISNEYGNKADLNILSKILNMSAEELQKKIRHKPESQFIPLKIKEDLKFKEIAMLEARKTEIPGLIIDIDMKRYYVYDKATAHILGYLGRITEEQIKFSNTFKDLPSYFKVGQTGLEYKYDEILRGKAGEKIVEVDSLGRELRLIRENPPLKGDDLYLTIDALLQEAAYKALENYNGAFVAVKIDTGEILAMVSTPSYDSNMFVETVPANYWNELINDSRKPLLNRAIQGLYPPGSTFKIISAIAALEEGIITPEQILVNCKGSISLGKWTFGCWKKEGHGPVNLKRALTESCDVYFYELGKILGPKKLAQYSRKFGLGNYTGFILDEKPGLVPDEEWKKKNVKASWFLGDTFNTVIGQGFLKVTPLQMAIVMATFVNGGIMYKPYIVRNTQPVGINLNIKPQNLDIIKNALVDVVNDPSGTAFKAKSGLIKFGGKTGTVQVVSKKIREKRVYKHFEHHAWFVGFAPVDNPEIAFSIIIEHGGAGGAVAAPIAKNILEDYILKKKKLYVKN